MVNGNDVSTRRWKVAGILGFEVFDQKGNLLGVLSEVIATGSNDVWVVSCYDEEILIPALKTTVHEVNILRKKIFVTLPKEYDNIYGRVKSADGAVEYNGYFVYED
jgi:16S rRNA processing protein RimM